MPTRVVVTDYADVQYLHAAGDLLQGAKLRSHALLQVSEGQHILDVGCGPGLDTVALAHLVGPRGRIAGVDRDPQMLAAADARAVAEGVAGWVTHEDADAAALPFATGTFDACRSERVFQDLLHPELVLAEMVRVLKPGGRVVVVDTDWGTSQTNTPDPHFERRLIAFAAEQRLRNPYSGRRLYGMLRQAGLTEVTAEPYLFGITDFGLAMHVQNWGGFTRAAVKVGVVTQAEVDGYLAALEEAAVAGTFFAMLGGVIAAGTKPIGGGR
jgi:ubiquinone/menaquinone biosynthesis C-methylase UbiE